jgi:hypothetical protein
MQIFLSFGKLKSLHCFLYISITLNGKKNRNTQRRRNKMEKWGIERKIFTANPPSAQTVPRKKDAE